MTTRGFSVRWNDIDEHEPMLRDTGATTARLFMCWKYLQSGHQPSPIDMSLTVDQAMRDGDALADEFLRRPELQRGLNHTATQLGRLSALGMRWFLSIGDGGANCLPSVVDSRNVSAPAVAMDPNIIGSETYLAHSYVLTRALVRRFKNNAEAIQLGNELNYCWVAALGGEFHWADGSLAPRRSAAASLRALPALRLAHGPAGGRQGATSWLTALIGQWGNASFIDRVVAVLDSAVKAEEASPPTSINYMVDVPPSFSALAEMPDWRELAKREPWQSAQQVLSIDTYPNFVFAQPPRSDVVRARVMEAVALAAGNPVWIAETGIGVLGAPTNEAFMATNFSEANQAKYYVDSYQQAQLAGATGFFAFGWWRDPGIAQPSGGFIADDQTGLMDIADLYLNGTSAIDALADFALTHLDYSVSRLAPLVANVSTHFGLFDQGGNARSGAGALKQLFGT